MSDPRSQRPTLRPLVLAFVLVFLIFRFGRADWVQSLSAEFPRTPKIFALTVAGPHLLAGFESGAFRSSDQGNTWTHVLNGMMGVPAVYSLASRGSTVFAGTVGGGVYRSADYGNSWSQAGLVGEYIFSIVPLDGALLATTCCHGLFRSVDDGASWTRPRFENADSIVIGDIAVSGALLFGGHARGLVRSSDQGASWTQIPAAGLSDSAVGHFAVVGTTLFAGAHNGLYRSEDNGSTWIRTALEAARIDVLTAGDRDLFVASGQRVLRSADRGDTWLQIDSGLAFNRGYFPCCLIVGGGNLFAGVVQAGVWRRPLSEFGTAIVPFRSSGSKATAVYSGSVGRPGFIPGWNGVLQTGPHNGFHIDGREVALPQRLR